MVDMSAIAGTVSALSGAMNIAQAMIGLRDTQMIQAKVIELQAKIIEANGNAFAAQDERAALLARIGDLEKEVTHLEAWGDEKQNYQLTDVGGGVLAYSLKPGMQSAEPPHLLCAHCYQHVRIR
jgi:hypothetical protein